MTRLIVLGASGSLGRHVLRQALAAGHEVTAFVRTPSKLPPEAQGRVSVQTRISAFSGMPLQLLTVQNLRSGRLDELIQSAYIAESREAADIDVR